MSILRQYKTFNNETGEIRIDCKFCVDYDTYSIIQNGELVMTTNDSDYEEYFENYYEKLKEMDDYISKKLKWYEVYEIL